MESNAYCHDQSCVMEVVGSNFSVFVDFLSKSNMIVLLI